MKYKTLVIIIILIRIIPANCQPKDDLPDTSDGNCYARSLVLGMISDTEEWFEDLIIFNGSQEVLDENIVLDSIQINNSPIIKYNFMTVLDTSITNAFVVHKQKITEHKFSSERKTEWFQVVCESDIKTHGIVDVLRKHMIENGLVSDLQTNFNYLEVLANYQRTHHLPIGNIDYLTLQHMGLSHLLD